MGLGVGGIHVILFVNINILYYTVNPLCSLPRANPSPIPSLSGKEGMWHVI